LPFSLRLALTQHSILLLNSKNEHVLQTGQNIIKKQQLALVSLSLVIQYLHQCLKTAVLFGDTITNMRLERYDI